SPIKSAQNSASSCERKLDSKGRSFTDLSCKIYGTVEKLHNSKRAGKSNAAASRPCRKKELKDFLAVLEWNSFAGVAHGNLRHLSAAAQHQPQLSAAGHRFSGVQHQIQHRLFQQCAIDVNFRHVDRQ